MFISRLRALLKDPILLLTLFAMIASTLISFLLVNKNYHKINMLESQARDKKIMVRELLDSVNQQYTQVSVLVLLDFMTEKNDEKTKLVRKKYFDVLPNLDINMLQYSTYLGTFLKQSFNDRLCLMLFCQPVLFRL